MTANEWFIVFGICKVLGGLSAFIYGMHMMTRSLTAAAGASQLSGPQGASAGPTARAVVPKERTRRGSSVSGAAPEGVRTTASAEVSMAQASAGRVGSARTMSHCSPLPSLTLTPSISAISAPA